jgi:DNA repair protein RadC
MRVHPLARIAGRCWSITRKQAMDNEATTTVRSESAADYRVPATSALTHAERVTIDEACRIIDAHLRDKGDAMTAPEVAARYFKLKIGAESREVFAAMFLDTRHRVIAWEPLFFGTIDGAEVHPREVVRRALLHNAAAVIIGHNHPSGNPEPSAADRAVTARLKESLKLVDVRLLDHFVCGEGEPVSLAARGWV